ncbi:MAG: TetR/AcrR family transcriptional regulator [Chloroflexi bacterium]|nr:TetR/AcrR family transcriptional regulator [Chloroflexota bacterium]
MPDEKPQSKGEQTRSAIIGAAYGLFLKNGFHGTSMRQIAEKADLALGGIYNHFGSKEEIFAAVLDAYHPYHTIFPALETTEGETVELFMRDAARRVKNEIEGTETKLLPLLFIELVEFQGCHLATLAEKLMPTILAFVQRMVGRQGKLRNVPPPIMIRMLFATFAGYLMTEMVLKNIPAFKNAELDWFDGMMDVYLHGILEPEA